MIPPRRLLASLLAASLGSPSALASDAGEGELALFQLDDVLKAETRVASSKAKSIRETPGIVTIVTRDEIAASGARDLVDVLAMVPGFQLGGDTENLVGIGFRGNWGSEGKVLVMVDGFVLNDLMYGAVNFGNHFPLDQIQQVEIIRGPGSAIYGGFAELAVVNIVTRGAKDLHGAAASAQVGQMDDGLARRTVSAGIGQSFGDLSFSAQAYVGQGARSDAIYRDPVDPAYDFRMNHDNSALDPLMVNVAAGWKGLQLRFLYDDLRTKSKDGYGEATYQALPVGFRTTAADARWDLPLGEGLTLTPRLTWTRQQPWQSKTVDPACPNDDPRCPFVTFYDKTAERIDGRLTLGWQPSGGFSVLVGGEAYRDHAFQNEPDVPGQYYFDGKTTVTFTDVAAFAEVGWDNPIANLLVGARFEHHSRFGNSFVPRLAVTKLFAPFHAKLLYSQAFKAPVLENIGVPTPDARVDIKPERTHVLEAEVGWQISDVAYVAANAYDVTIDDAIVFSTGTLPTGEIIDVYSNYAKTGTRGVEGILRLQARWVTAQAGYSFYTTAGKNQVDVYQVPGHGNLMLGFAAHKATAQATFHLGDHLLVTPSLLFLSDRYGYTSIDADGNSVLGTIPAAVYVNLFLLYRNLLARGLDVGAGVYDLFDQGATWVQPYDGGHPPLPGTTREYLVRVSYATP